jgi:hypothetical protein
MSSPVFHHLRRCRVLFALAFCAWLLMGSAAWAKPACCDSMDMSHMHTMTMHADVHAAHPHGHAVAGCDCTCAHLSVASATLAMDVANAPIAARLHWRALPQDAPQPRYAPPLRPPSV